MPIKQRPVGTIKTGRRITLADILIVMADKEHRQILSSGELSVLWDEMIKYARNGIPYFLKSEQ